MWNSRNYWGGNIGKVSLYRECIKKMTDSLIHRGPDDEGHEFFENCVMGFRRLAIVDLSEDGHQPMYSCSKNECITFNGEIYGYRSLKEQLDYPFKSGTDTEVILALYQKYGKTLVEHLNGMFSFAIWNEEKQELFCGRDRFGEKPFFYSFSENNEFIYASEIKAILASGLVKPELNKEALHHYLRYGFIHPKQSIYKNIFVLPPAHTLLYREGEIVISKYWELPSEELDISEEEAIDKFKDLINKSIEKQMIADVNVGAFLSGGLDSGTVVALSSEYTDNLKTIGFAYEGSWNEMPEARQVADKYNCEHMEVFMDEGEELALVLEEVISKLDEPLSDTAIPAAYKICEKAKEEMTVVMTGNAGDELFGGYKWYLKELEILEDGEENPLFLPLYKLGAIVAEKFNSKKCLSKFQSKILKAKYSDIITYQKENNNFFSQDEIEKMGLKIIFEEEYDILLDKNNLNSCMNMDLVHILPGDYLVKDDRISMLHSIELRTPFLDKDLVEFCVSLPAKYKLNNEHGKLLLRKAFGDKLPSDILNKQKQGFGAPVQQWLKFSSMESLTEKYLKNKEAEIFKYLDYTQIQKYLDYTYKHWCLLVLGIWFDKVYTKNSL